MTLPANVRVNTGAPWPAQVKGSGPVAVSRLNGIWTLLLSIANLVALPTGSDPTKSLVLIWNVVSQTWQQTTIAALIGAGTTPTNVNFAMSPYTPLGSDSFLYVDTSGGSVEIDLTPAALRGGSPLSIKDVTGNGAANNITIKPVGGIAPETIDGHTNAAPLKINSNYGGFRLNPGTLKYVIAP